MGKNPSAFLPVDASTMVDVLQYYQVRCLEMGASLLDVTIQEDGCFLATIRYHHQTYHSVFIPPHLRGLGLIKNYSHLTFITVKDCGIEAALKKLSFNYHLVEGWFDHEEYHKLKECLVNEPEVMMDTLINIDQLRTEGDVWFIIPFIAMQRNIHETNQR